MIEFDEKELKQDLNKYLDYYSKSYKDEIKEFFNKNANFLNRLFERCALLKQTNSTTFYAHEFKSDIPIGQMTDKQMYEFLVNVYKHKDIQNIIDAMND